MVSILLNKQGSQIERTPRAGAALRDLGGEDRWVMEIVWKEELLLVAPSSDRAGKWKKLSYALRLLMESQRQFATEIGAYTAGRMF